MGIGLDPLNTLLIFLIVLVAALLIWDVYAQQVTSLWARYRARLAPGPLSWRDFLPFVVAVLLATIMRQAVLLSAYLIAVGVVITLYSLRRARQKRQSLPARQVLQLVLAFRSLYQLQPSVFSILDRVTDKVDEPLRSLLGIVTHTFYLTSSPERAFVELRSRTDNVYLNQFAYILEMSESASADAVAKALDNLVDRLRTHDDLRRETESSLTSITGQTKVIQALAILAIVLVSLVPSLRAAYVSPIGQVYLITFITVILIASYQIDRVIGKLTERIS